MNSEQMMRANERETILEQQADDAMGVARSLEEAGQFAEADVWRRDAETLREEAYLVSHSEERQDQ